MRDWPCLHVASHPIKSCSVAAYAPRRINDLALQRRRYTDLEGSHDGLGFETFGDALFELAAAWSADVSIEECTAFLWRLFRQLTTSAGESEWRRLEDCRFGASHHRRRTRCHQRAATDGPARGSLRALRAELHALQPPSIAVSPRMTHQLNSIERRHALLVIQATWRSVRRGRRYARAADAWLRAPADVSAAALRAASASSPPSSPPRRPVSVRVRRSDPKSIADPVPAQRHRSHARRSRFVTGDLAIVSPRAHDAAPAAAAAPCPCAAHGCRDSPRLFTPPFSGGFQCASARRAAAAPLVQQATPRAWRPPPAQPTAAALAERALGFSGASPRRSHHLAQRTHGRPNKEHATWLHPPHMKPCLHQLARHGAPVGRAAHVLASPLVMRLIDASCPR